MTEDFFGVTVPLNFRPYVTPNLLFTVVDKKNSSENLLKKCFECVEICYTNILYNNNCVRHKKDKTGLK